MATILTTTLTHPIQIQVYESNTEDAGEMVELHSLTALAEWCEYEVSCYVTSRAIVRLALDKFTMDIISGKYKFRTFQVETIPYPEYEGPRVWTRYIVQAIEPKAPIVTNTRRYDEDGHCTICTTDDYECYCWNA